MLGHSDTRQVKVYTKGANKRRMARSALAALLEAEQVRTSVLQTSATGLTNSARKPLKEKELK